MDQKHIMDKKKEGDRKMEKYAIGVDFGTESGRAVLVSVKDGREIADHVTPYKHKVIEEKLPGSEVELGSDWALQHPQDYLDVIEKSIPAIMQQSAVSPDDVVGLGIDFTACTMLPI